MKQALQRKAPKKEDQRVRVTKEMLRNAFVTLLEQKPVAAVTVKELCAVAGINRGTFYLHYYDVYDMMEKLEEELLCQLQQVLQENPVIGYTQEGSADTAFTMAVFRFLDNNRQLCGVLLGDNGDRKFIDKIIEMGREKSVREYMSISPGTTKTQAELFYAFVASGFLGALKFSTENPGLITTEKLASCCSNIVLNGVGFFGMSM